MMTSCPYPIHQGAFDVALNHSVVAYCRDGCGRTFFLCERCEAANKSLARFCRQCGEPVLFEAAQAHLGRVRLLQEERTESYKLSEYGVTEVQVLKAYKGLLILVADLRLLIYDLHKIYEPLYQFTPPDQRVIRGVTI